MAGMMRLMGLAVVLVGLLVYPSKAADIEEARRQLSDAVESAEEMVVHLQEGQMGVFMKHTSNFIMHAKAALEEIPAESEMGAEVAGHLKMAISEAEEALGRGQIGDEEAALNHALSALSHAEEANSFADIL